MAFFVKSERLFSLMRRACKSLIWTYRLADVKVQMCRDHRANKWLLPLNEPRTATGSFCNAASSKTGNRQEGNWAPHCEFSSIVCKFQTSHVHMIKGLRTHEPSACMSAVEGKTKGLSRGQRLASPHLVLLYSAVFTQKLMQRLIDVRTEGRVVSDEQAALKSACLHNEARMAFFCIDTHFPWHFVSPLSVSAGCYSMKLWGDAFFFPHGFFIARWTALEKSAEKKQGAAV